MFELYEKIVKQHNKSSLKYERKLIALAKRGNISAREKLLLSNIWFFLFRIKTKLYPVILKRYGEDILQDCIGLAINKIYTYNLRYRNKQGKFQPVYFRTYLWKAITGLIIDSVKNKNRKEICISDLSDSETKRYI